MFLPYTRCIYEYSYPTAVVNSSIYAAVCTSIALVTVMCHRAAIIGGVGRNVRRGDSTLLVMDTITRNTGSLTRVCLYSSSIKYGCSYQKQSTFRENINVEP